MSVWFFLSLTTCLLLSYFSILCFCHCFYTFSFQLILFFNVDAFHLNSITFSSLSSLLHLYLAVLTSSHTLTPPQRVIFFPLYMWRFLLWLDISFTSLPSFIEWPLSYDHLSLLPLLFPLPSLSISLGGPAFLPGFCRPRCENWRWRGRRSGNQRSRPQSLFLGHFLWQLTPQWSPPPNCRPSLSTHSSSTS